MGEGSRKNEVLPAYEVLMIFDVKVIRS